MIDLGSTLSEELKEYEQTAGSTVMQIRTDAGMEKVIDGTVMKTTGSVVPSAEMALIESQKKRIRDLEEEVADLKAHPKIETRVETKTVTQWKTDTKYVYRDKCSSCEIQEVRKTLADTQVISSRMRAGLRASAIVEVLIMLLGSFFTLSARADWIRAGRFAAGTGRAIAALAVGVWMYMGKSLELMGLHNVTAGIIIRIITIIVPAGMIAFAVFLAMPTILDFWTKIRRFLVFDYYTGIAAMQILTLIIALAEPVSRIMPGNLNIYLLLLPAILLYLAARHLCRIFKQRRQQRQRW